MKPSPRRKHVHATLGEGRRDWYRISNHADSGTAEIYLFDEIGYWGTSAQDFVDELKTITATDIALHINSPGGEIFDGLAIFNCLKAHPADVHVVIDGLAASAASFVAMAGDRITVGRNATMMVHEGAGLCIGDASDMQEMADLLDKLSGNIADIYAQRAGGTVESWREAMHAETWYTGAEAVAAGLADEMTDPDPSPPDEVAARMSATWDLSIFRHAGRENAPDPQPVATLEGEPEPQPAHPGPEPPADPKDPDETPGPDEEEPENTSGQPVRDPESLAECNEWASITAALTAPPDDPWDALTGGLTTDPLEALREATP